MDVYLEVANTINAEISLMVDAAENHHGFREHEIFNWVWFKRSLHEAVTRNLTADKQA